MVDRTASEIEGAGHGRRLALRTRGHDHGPVTRLFSPGDLGRQIAPFVFLDRIDMDASEIAMFGYHPHSGIVTVTTVTEGDTAYEDSTGATGVLGAGGVEWMRAGNGVWHTARPERPGKVKGYQLWLALPEDLENAPAESRFVASEQVPSVGGVRVILGEYGGVASPLPRTTSLNYLHVMMKAKEAWTYLPPDDHSIAWAAVSGGAVEASGETLSNELAVFENGGGHVNFRAISDAELMIGSAVPHPFKLVTGHYSVHTSEAALTLGEAGIEAVRLKLKAEGKI